MGNKRGVYQCCTASTAEEHRHWRTHPVLSALWHDAAHGSEFNIWQNGKPQMDSWSQLSEWATRRHCSWRATDYDKPETAKSGWIPLKWEGVDIRPATMLMQFSCREVVFLQRMVCVIVVVMARSSVSSSVGNSQMIKPRRHLLTVGCDTTHVVI